MKLEACVGVLQQHGDAALDGLVVPPAAVADHDHGTIEIDEPLGKQQIDSGAPPRLNRDRLPLNGCSEERQLRIQHLGDKLIPIGRSPWQDRQLIGRPDIARKAGLRKPARAPGGRVAKRVRERPAWRRSPSP